MNGIYLIHLAGQFNNKASGIGRKIQSQIDIFNNNNLNCKIACVCPKEPSKSVSFVTKVLMLLPFTNINPKWEYNDHLSVCDYIYLRRPSYYSYSFLKFLGKIKRSNPTVKILVEIPTYPYDKEFTGLFKLMKYKEFFGRKMLKNCIDRFVVTNESPDILWGVPVIRIYNGIDLTSVSQKSIRNISNDEINLICISSCEYWHGYDRLLRGLADYNNEKPKKKVVLHFVGEGVCLEQYKNIVEECNLEDCVTFYGKQCGKELDKIYDLCDISVGCLGIHRRSKGWISGELKSREAVIKGIPYISAGKIDIFEEYGAEYCAYVPEDESNINIHTIVEFYEKIYNSNSNVDVITAIREKYSDKVDINTTMMPVINYIKGFKSKEENT